MVAMQSSLFCLFVCFENPGPKIYLVLKLRNIQVLFDIFFRELIKEGIN